MGTTSISPSQAMPDNDDLKNRCIQAWNTRAQVAAVDAMVTALKRCEFDFDVLITRGDLEINAHPLMERLSEAMVLIATHPDQEVSESWHVLHRLRKQLRAHLELVSTSTTSGLAEALRDVRRYEVAGLPCYCETRSRDRAANESDFYERKSDDEHEEECTAAREALARWEGKGAIVTLTKEQAETVEAEMRRLEADAATDKHALRLFMQEPMPCGHAAGNLLTCDSPPFGCLICGPIEGKG